MGLLSFCMGGGSSSAAVLPEQSVHDHPDRERGAILMEAASVENADTLVHLLTRAQQMELQSAFRQFDINGNGTM